MLCSHKEYECCFTKNLFLNNAYKIVLPVTRIGKLSLIRARSVLTIVWVDSFHVSCVDHTQVGEAQVGAQVQEVKGTVNSGRAIRLIVLWSPKLKYYYYGW